MTTFEAARLEAAGRWNTRVLLRRYAVRRWGTDTIQADAGSPSGEPAIPVRPPASAGPLARRVAAQHPAPTPLRGPAWLARLTAKEFHA